jgi:plasmid stability protein
MSNVQVKNLDSEVHDLLRERAVATGLTISDYVLELIRRDLQLPSRRQWLSPDEQPSRLSRLVNRSEVVVGDSADFIHLDWSSEWQG